MTAYQFSQPWLSMLGGDSEPTAREFANLRNYLKGIDDGTISLFNPKLLNATINALTAGGNITMGGFKLTGLGAGSVNGDSLRYEQVIGLYLLLTGGTMSGAIAMGSNKITGLTNGSAASDAAAFGQIPVFTTWAAYTPTITGAGTAANVDFYWRQEADSIHVRGAFKTGTVGVVISTITLPSGKNVDNTKIPTATGNTAIAGCWFEGSGSIFASAGNMGVVFADGGTPTTTLYFCRLGASGSGCTKQNGNAIWASTEFIMMDFNIALA